jgi:hypothetical protein
VSEQKPVDHFTIIPRRFTDAHLADEIDSIHLVIGVHIAARCYEVRNTSDGVAAIRLSSLAELCGDVSTETIRRKLHELEPAWIACEVGQGQRSAWRIRLTGLAHEADAGTPPPRDFHATSTETPLPVWKLTSTELDASGATIPHDERDAGPARPPQPVSERQNKRNETRRDEYEKRAGTEEKLDTAVAETTTARLNPLDALERAPLR